MTSTERPATGTWRARESRALRVLLEDAGVGSQDFIDGGPDGQDLQDLVFADIETWNAFGLLAQDFVNDDDTVHARLVGNFVIEPRDEHEDGWGLIERAADDPVAVLARFDAGPDVADDADPTTIHDVFESNDDEIEYLSNIASELAEALRKVLGK